MDYTGKEIFKRELLTRGNLGPGHSTELSKYGTNFLEATASIDSVSVYKLPVGIKHVEKLEDSSLTSNTKHEAAWRLDDNEKKQNHAGTSISWSGLTDIDFNNIVPSYKKGNSTVTAKKQRMLSVRAASMLVNSFFCLMHQNIRGRNTFLTVQISFIFQIVLCVSKTLGSHVYTLLWYGSFLCLFSLF